MKNLIIAILIACLAIMGSTLPTRAQAPIELATKDEALTIAKNWITLIIQKKGTWGDAETAEVDDCQEFKHNEQILGYFCPVKPRGFIVISLYKVLAPVKAYSAVSDLDPESDEGMSDLIKESMERVLDRIEQSTGLIETTSIEDLENVLEIDYRRSWQELESNVEIFKEGIETGGLEMNYQEGQVLLSTAWDQDPPYNNDCPWMNCSNSNGRAIVGCVATAGAQIMRYWNWPPYGQGSPYSDTYDWPNMRNTITTSAPQVQIDAVAELSHEVGQAVGMDYGCNESSANTYDMEDVYENHYRYSTACTKEDRDDYSGVAWFNRMKAQFNVNRPIHYRVVNHSIVADGWQEIGSTPIRQYHMNYGWANSDTAWYTLDALYLGDPDEEYMLESIYPAQALGSWIAGTYSRQSFPYRYFDQDATGSSATFEAGQYLQFLPGITVTGTDTSGQTIRIKGSSSANTRLFARGDISIGIRIYNGAMKLTNNGSITIP